MMYFFATPNLSIKIMLLFQICMENSSHTHKHTHTHTEHVPLPVNTHIFTRKIISNSRFIFEIKTVSENRMYVFTNGSYYSLNLLWLFFFFIQFFIIRIDFHLKFRDMISSLFYFVHI